MLDARPARLALPVSPLVVLLLVAPFFVALTACAEADGAADGPASEPTAGSTPAASEAAKGSKPPLPPAASADGDLPRSYGGWTLGDPAPAIEAKGEDSRYPGAAIHCKPLDESPKTRLCAYVDQGTIFRIEWRSRNPSMEIDDVVATFVPLLGEPEDAGILDRPYYEYWNDGLTEGTTTWIVNRLRNDEWIRVGVEDTVRAGKITGYL